MRIVGASHAKTHFSPLLLEVEHGRQILITKYGRPVAKLVPVSQTTRESIKLTIQHLKEFQRANILGDVDWKTLRDEGRR